MKAKYILQATLALLLVAATPSCADWGELPDGYTYADDSKSPSPTKPTVQGTLVETGLVDLGLSVKWAACNLGASYCWEYGNSYNFGNTASYCPEEIGGTADDHATEILGAGWATPSKAQWQELIDKCLIENTSYRGVYGLIVTGPSKKAIFLPRSTETGYNYYRYYWTSSLDLSSNEGYVFELPNYYPDYRFESATRGSNRSIRPIKY